MNFQMKWAFVNQVVFVLEMHYWNGEEIFERRV